MSEPTKNHRLVSALPALILPAAVIGILLVVALVVGLAVPVFPVSFTLAFAAAFAALMVVVTASISTSRKAPPSKFLNAWLLGLLFIWIVWPSYITYKAGPLPGISPTRILYWGLIGLWFYWIISSDILKKQLYENVARHKSFIILVAAYFLWQLICSVTGESTFSSIYYTVKGSAGGILLLLVVLSLLKTREDIEKIFIVAVSAALAVGLIGIVEAIRGTNPFSLLLPSDPEQLAALEWILQDKSRSGAYRISSTFAHPLTLAEYLLMCLPISGYLAAKGRSNFARAVGFLAIPVIAAAIYFTRTRSALVGAGIVLFMVFVVWSISAIRQKNNFAGAIVGIFLLTCVVLTTIAASAFAINIAQGRDRDEQGSTNARIYQLNIGSKAVAEQPIVGYGPGLAAIKIGYMPGARTLTIDNHYLSVAIDTGIPGLLLYSLILLLPVLYGFHLALGGLTSVNLMGLASATSLLAFAFERVVLSLTHNFDFAYVIIAIILVLRNLDRSGFRSQ